MCPFSETLIMFHFSQDEVMKVLVTDILYIIFLMVLKKYYFKIYLVAYYFVRNIYFSIWLLYVYKVLFAWYNYSVKQLSSVVFLDRHYLKQPSRKERTYFSKCWQSPCVSLSCRRSGAAGIFLSQVTRLPSVL